MKTAFSVSRTHFVGENKDDNHLKPPIRQEAKKARRWRSGRRRRRRRRLRRTGWGGGFSTGEVAGGSAGSSFAPVFPLSSLLLLLFPPQARAARCGWRPAPEPEALGAFAKFGLLRARGLPWGWVSVWRPGRVGERSPPTPEGGGRAGRRRAGAAARPAVPPARHGSSKPSASRERDVLRLGGLCILGSQRRGWRPPTSGPVEWPMSCHSKHRDSE
ncbi:uncharacterized protein LOC129404341 [Sorex araneus]|uniref:uncharacterized protein LOC129404341 n=1 Tax=Sorex araneus TaxID=42254 RepID=UPI00243361A0|nr:uncharacterized protein LOC129404341 [Sorex araneus]